jgi:hypothetical protein
MSYREENGQVILTMNKEDYETLRMGLQVSRLHPV